MRSGLRVCQSMLHPRLDVVLSGLLRRIARFALRPVLAAVMFSASVSVRLGLLRSMIQAVHWSLRFLAKSTATESQMLRPSSGSVWPGLLECHLLVQAGTRCYGARRALRLRRVSAARIGSAT